MEKHNFTVLIEKDEDGILVASVPALKGCHSQAKTMDELLSRIKEAIELCVEVDRENLIGKWCQAPNILTFSMNKHSFSPVTVISPTG